MKPTGELFTIRYNNKQVAIETYTTNSIDVYCIKLSDNEQIFISKIENSSNKEDFWSTIPEGNSDVAKQIGEIIENRNGLLKQSKLF